MNILQRKKLFVTANKSFSTTCFLGTNELQQALLLHYNTWRVSVDSSVSWINLPSLYISYMTNTMQHLVFESDIESYPTIIFRVLVHQSTYNCQTLMKLVDSYERTHFQPSINASHSVQSGNPFWAQSPTTPSISIAPCFQQGLSTPIDFPLPDPPLFNYISMSWVFLAFSSRAYYSSGLPPFKAFCSSLNCLPDPFPSSSYVNCVRYCVDFHGSSLITMSSRKTLFFLLKHLFMTACCCLLVMLGVTLHFSHMYNSMDLTLALNRRNSFSF